jgi:DNA-binding transcriptional LysR family regulator
MSVSLAVTGPLVTVKAKPAVTTATTIFTAGSSNPWLVGLQVSNTSSTNATMLLELVSDGVGYAILPTMTVPGLNSSSGPPFPIAMRSGDAIRATAGTADVLSVVMTIMDGPGAVK